MARLIRIIRLAPIGVALAAAVGAGAQNLVLNGSFEENGPVNLANPGHIGNVFMPAPPSAPPWGFNGLSEIIDGHSLLAPQQAQDGRYYAQLMSGGGSGSMITEDIHGLTPGHEYAIQFYSDSGLSGGPDGGGAMLNVSVGNTAFDTIFHRRIAGGPWAGYQATFFADSTSETLRFSTPPLLGDSYPTASLDHISLTIVPAPAAFVAYAVALANGRRRRRRAIAARTLSRPSLAG